MYRYPRHCSSFITLDDVWRPKSSSQYQTDSGTDIINTRPTRHVTMRGTIADYFISLRPSTPTSSGRPVSSPPAAATSAVNHPTSVSSSLIRLTLPGPHCTASLAAGRPLVHPPRVQAARSAAPPSSRHDQYETQTPPRWRLVRKCKLLLQIGGVVHAGANGYRRQRRNQRDVLFVAQGPSQGRNSRDEAGGVAQRQGDDVEVCHLNHFGSRPCRRRDQGAMSTESLSSAIGNS
jgi:hypothetical protein